MHSWFGSLRNGHIFLKPLITFFSGLCQKLNLSFTWIIPNDYFLFYLFLKFFQFSSDSLLETMCENIFMWSLLPRFVASGGVESADKANDCVWVLRLIRSGVPEAGVLGIMPCAYVCACAHTYTHTCTFTSALVVTELAALVMSSAWRKAFFSEVALWTILSATYSASLRFPLPFFLAYTPGRFRTGLCITGKEPNSCGAAGFCADVRRRACSHQFHLRARADTQRKVVLGKEKECTCFTSIFVSLN